MTRRLRRVLMIAFHFPPMRGSSGIQRTLRFVQHLPSLGWEPIVLTAREHAYKETSNDLLADLPTDLRVIRAIAPDTARHLAIAGRYPAALARPDRWKLWAYFGVRAGRQAIEEFKPDAIWSTYPIASAHLIGAALQATSRLPWIADFRDPMAQDDFPSDPRTWQSFLDIESRAVAKAARCVFVTPSAASLYRQRYGQAAAERFELIENGYDEASFQDVERSGACLEPLIPGRITLLHSGIVYPSERDPTALFKALAVLVRKGELAPEHLCIRFRAPVHEDMLRSMAKAEGVLDLVDIAAPIPYREALHEMLRADGLLVMQAANCNAQIPAKVYEYLRARRPILGLADPAGDTGKMLAHAGVAHVGQLEDSSTVARLLRTFLYAIANGTGPYPHQAAISEASRMRKSELLAALLDAVRDQPNAAAAPVISPGRASPGTSWTSFGEDDHPS